MNPNKKENSKHEVNKDLVLSMLTDFVKVEGGRFLMGSPESEKFRRNDEMQHEVEVSDFMIQSAPVSQSLYEAITGENPSTDKTWKDMPVTNVNWEDTQSFIQRLNEITGGKFRLPTEAEWEYAARGGNRSQGFLYSGSNDIEEVAWYTGNSGNRLHVVKEKQPNELGIYDMSGNILEWCSDFYAEYRLDAKGRVNPKGADNGVDRVLRGGSWNSLPEICRVTYRSSYNPRIRYYTRGFRLVFSE